MKSGQNSGLWPAFTRVKHPRYKDIKTTFVRGEGAYLYDSFGKRYFDGFSTLWTNLVGHGRMDIIEPMVEQMKSLSFMHLFTCSQHEPALRLSKTLTELSPFDHRYCFFGCSGSDATETAIKMARAYWYYRGKKEKNIIVGRGSEYHGTSFGALSLMGCELYRTPYKPLTGGVQMLPPPNCFRCPFEKQIDSCGMECYCAFENCFDEIDAVNNVAAVLVEPIITSDGLITPPPTYWERIQKLCEENDVLLIADEVSTGMGRCGSMFSASIHNLKPDILYLAKSLTSGYAPLSAVLANEKIYDTINNGSSYFTHGSTFAGHPVACVAAESVIQIVTRDGLIESGKKIATTLQKIINKELLDLDRVGNIRGAGTLFEIELVKDKITREIPSNETELSMRLYSELLHQGLYLRVLGRFICIAPPLISSENECIEMIRVLRQSIKKVSEIKSLW